MSSEGEGSGSREGDTPEFPVLRTTIFRDSIDLGFTFRDRLLKLFRHQESGFLLNERYGAGYFRVRCLDGGNDRCGGSGSHVADVINLCGISLYIEKARDTADPVCWGFLFGWRGGSGLWALPGTGPQSSHSLSLDPKRLTK
jgi:hypothetical protein